MQQLAVGGSRLLWPVAVLSRRAVLLGGFRPCTGLSAARGPCACLHVLSTQGADMLYCLLLLLLCRCCSYHCVQVLILVAETGAGKTTQVPQYLHEAGYSKLGKVWGGWWCWFREALGAGRGGGRVLVLWGAGGSGGGRGMGCSFSKQGACFENRDLGGRQCARATSWASSHPPREA